MNDNDKLWCIHIPGPDDFYAAPSKEAAEALAARHNAAMVKYWEELQMTKPPEALQFYPPIESVLARACAWPYFAEDHAEALEDWEEVARAGLDF